MRTRSDWQPWPKQLAVCAAFNTADRLADAFGFELLSPEGFEASAARAQQMPAESRTMPLESKVAGMSAGLEGAW